MDFGDFKSEARVILKTSWPMSLVFWLQMLTLPISIMFCGHLGTEVMDAVSMAGTFLTLFGVYAYIGMATACYTVFSQLFGSPARANMGLMLQRGLVVLMLGCVMLVAILINVEFLMLLAGQSVNVTRQTGNFLHVAIVGLPGMAVWSVLRSYTYTQGIIHAHYVIFLVSNLVDVGLHVMFVKLLGMGSWGAALSYCLTNWLIAGLYILYIIFMKSYEVLWAGWTIECFDNLGEYLKLGIFGTMTFIIELGVYEIIALTVARFQVVEQDAFGIAYTLLMILYAIPQGLVYAAFVRVGNHLGANNPKKAKCAFWTTILLSVPICIVFPVAMICLRREIPYMFTNNRDVADLSSVYFLWVALLLLFDIPQMSLKGILGSLGRQSYAAGVNMFAYFILCLGLAFPLMLKTSLGVRGSFVALIVAPVTQCVLFMYRLMIVDWEKEAFMAQKRAAEVNNQCTQSAITPNEGVNTSKSLDSLDTPPNRTYEECGHVLKTTGANQLNIYGSTMSTEADIRTLQTVLQTDESLSDNDKSEESGGIHSKIHRKKVLVYKSVAIISMSIAIIAVSIALNRFLAKCLY